MCQGAVSSLHSQSAVERVKTTHASRLHLQVDAAALTRSAGDVMQASKLKKTLFCLNKM